MDKYLRLKELIREMNIEQSEELVSLLIDIVPVLINYFDKNCTIRGATDLFGWHEATTRAYRENYNEK